MTRDERKALREEIVALACMSPSLTLGHALKALDLLDAIETEITEAAKCVGNYYGMSAHVRRAAELLNGRKP